MTRTRPQTASDQAIRITLLIGLVLTSAALTRVTLWKRNVPEPQLSVGILNDQLTKSGWELSASIPSRKGQTVSAGPGYRYSRTSPGQPASLEQMTLIPVRVRGFRDLDSETIHSYLQEEGTQSNSSSTVKIDRDDLLLSKNNNEQRLETCIARDQASSSGTMLTEALAAEPLSLRERVLVIAGLRQPRRWECLFVQFSTKADPNSTMALEQAWRESRDLLKRIKQ